MDDSARRLEAHDRVLLIRLGAVGDVLRTLPALHLIRATYPTVRVSWLVEDLSRDLLVDHPEVAEVLRFPRRELRDAAAHPLRLKRLLSGLAHDLRSRHFDVALDFQGSFKSGLLARLSGAPRRIGLAPGHSREFSWMFTNEWVRPSDRHLNRVERNLLIAEAVGARGDTIELTLPEDPEEGAAADKMLHVLNPRGLPLVVLSPGTSRRQRRKRWPAGHFSMLAGRLASEDGALVLVVWGPGEEELSRSIAAAAGGRAMVAPPTTLRLLAAILRRAALFVGADTGPMHLAWGVGCPVLALFGPTDPRLNAPLGNRHVVLRSGRLTSGITPDKAFESARRILASSATFRPGPSLPRTSILPRTALGDR